MSHGVPFGLGDLARAFASLQPENEATRRAIALSLLGGASERSSEALERKEQEERGERRAGENPPPHPPAPQRPSHERPAREQDETRIPIPIDIDHIRRPPPRAPAWLSTAEPLRAPRPEAPAPQPPPALLEPRRRRALLSAMAATPGDGPIDVEALVRSAATGKVLRQLPRRTIPALVHGVQLLVDRSDAMLPFHLDVERLEQEILQLVGAQSVEVLRFVACPSRGCGRGPRRRWKPYGTTALPRPGTRVLCVTDLGIGRAPLGEPPAWPKEWMDFAAQVRRAGCSVGALVPYPPERWPRELGRLLEIFPWDRSMTVARAVRGLSRRR